MFQKFKKNWIIFRELGTELSIYINLTPNKFELFKQDLTKNRPYLVIEEDENNLLILTLTKAASWERFGPIKCDCLELDTYIILDTKIRMTWDFARKNLLNLSAKNNQIKHHCLSEPWFLKLREALKIYWDKKYAQLTLIELGMKSKLAKRRKIKRKTIPLFNFRS